MKAEYVGPFVDGITNFFSTMLSASCNRVEPGTGVEAEPKEVTAIIGLGGPARGIVALQFPRSTALALSSRLLGMDVQTLDETVSDVVAEVVNIVAGSAKAKLSAATGSLIDLSLPTVFRGQGYSVHYPSQSPWTDVPFNSDLGSFHMRVSFEVKNKPV